MSADRSDASRAPERRHYTRRAIAGVAGRVGFSQRLRLLDISAQGARIATGESLAPGRRYHFQLAGVQVTAEVVRCTLVQLAPDDEGARAVFEAGIVFDSLTPAQRRELRQLAAAAPASASASASASATAGDRQRVRDAIGVAVASFQPPPSCSM
jgi:hypothetical protein